MKSKSNPSPRTRRLITRRAFVSGTAAVAGLSLLPRRTLRAADLSPAPDHSALKPIGHAKGIHPGRVVWVHDPEVLDWKGPGDGHWYDAGHIRQERVDGMMSRAVCDLAGESGVATAWDRLFRHFNEARGNGVAGYQAGEKILIKPNWVGMIWREGAVDPESYTLIKRLDYMNTAPQMIIALIRQLVSVGVNQSDITVCDSLAYLVNFATLKAHVATGVTLCGKNHFGSLVRWPVEKGYYDMHRHSFAKETNRYREQVDLLGHAHLGGKTVLNLVDGLFSGKHPIDPVPRRMTTTPFAGDWAKSLFASQDPIAIDSVGFDFLHAEYEDYPRRPGVDDYLHEAALADAPPSGTYYDPDHSTPERRLASLGVHEHWNSPEEKRYSRNLGTGAGIELVPVEMGR